MIKLICTNTENTDYIKLFHVTVARFNNGSWAHMHSHISASVYMCVLICMRCFLFFFPDIETKLVSESQAKLGAEITESESRS